MKFFRFSDSFFRLAIVVFAVFTLTSTAYAAYTCSVVYTSCNEISRTVTKTGTSCTTETCTGTCTPTTASSCSATSCTPACATTTCEVACSAGQYLNGSACASCGGNGYYCPGGSWVPNGGAQGRNAVSAGYYSTGGDSNTRTGQSQCTGATYCSGGVQTACPTAESGWTAGTGTGWTGFANCFESKTGTAISSYCSAGQLRKTASSASTWGTTITIATALQAAAGSYVNGQTCSQCTGATYSAAGTQTSCSACPTNYDDNTAAGKTAATQCQINCAAGQYVATANAACSAIPVAGYRTATQLTNYGSVGTYSSCPTNYDDGTTTGKTAATQCQISCAAGNYVAVANSTCAAIPAGGYRAAAQLTGYGSTGTYDACNANYLANAATGKTAATQCQINCAAGQYVATANAACSAIPVAGYRTATQLTNYGSVGTYSSCPTNYDDGTTTGKTAASQCQISCAAGNYVAVANSTCAAIPADGYRAAVQLTNYGSTGTYDTCNANYRANAATGKTVASQCLISCAAGTRIAAPNASACTSPSGGWFTAAHNVGYGLISPVNYCTQGFSSSGTTAATHDAMADCVKTVADGNYIPQITTQARYIKFTANGSTANTGNHVVEIQAFASSNATGTNLLSGVTTGTGSNLGYATNDSWDRTTYASCAATGCIWDMGTVQTVGSIEFSLYTDGRTYHDVTLYVSTDNTNWTTIFGPVELLTQNSIVSTGEILVVSSLDTACAAGTARASHSITLGSTSICTACSGSLEYQDQTEQTTCKTVSTGYYKGSNSAQALCPAGYQSGSGAATQNACKPANCSAGAYWNGSGTPACATCTAGNYCTGVSTVTYGTRTTTVGLSACAAVESGWTAGTQTGNAAATNCTETKTGSAISSYCAAGVLTKTAADASSWGATVTTTTALQAVAGAYISGQTCAQCTGATWCSGGVQNTCPGTYTANTTAGKTAQSSCQVSCAAGQYVAAANAACSAIPADGYRSAAQLTNYGSTGSYNTCDANYRANAATAKTAVSQCQISCVAGQYVAVANAACSAIPADGYRAAAQLTGYGSTGSYDSCDANYRANATTGKDAASDCQTSCAAGTRVAATGAACSTPNGSWYSGLHTVNFGSTSAGSSCITNYATANTTTLIDHDSYNDCKQTCSAGYYVPTTTAACTVVGTGYYRAGSATVVQTSTSAGQTLARTACSIGAYSDATTGAACTACADGMTTSSTASTSAACSACPGDEGVYTYTDQEWTSGTNTVVNMCTASLCNIGYYLSGGSCLPCPAGSYCAGSYIAPALCPIGSYQTEPGTYECTTCQPGMTNSAAGSTSSACVACSNSTGVSHWVDVTWYTSSPTSVYNLCNASSCEDGYYKNLYNCDECPTGNYCSGSTKSLCVTGSYQSATNKNVCTPCAGGKTNSGSGNVSACTTTCSNYANVATWISTAWNSNNTVTDLCKAATCMTGHQVSGSNCVAKTYSISLDANGGIAGVTTTITATYNMPVPAVTGLPSRSGHIFTGYWSEATGGLQYVAEDGESTSEIWITDSAATLYAQWRKASIYHNGNTIGQLFINGIKVTRAYIGGYEVFTDETYGGTMMMRTAAPVSMLMESALPEILETTVEEVAYGEPITMESPITESVLPQDPAQEISIDEVVVKPKKNGKEKESKTRTDKNSKRDKGNKESKNR